MLPTESHVELSAPALPQKLLSRRLDAACLAHDVEACAPAADRAQIRSEALPGAGDFLHTIPSLDLRLAFRPDEFTVELKRRLLVDISARAGLCSMCNAPMDKRGYHALRCACGGDRTRWHHTLRNHFAQLCEGAGLQAEVEAPHLLLPDVEHPGQEERRPADVFLPVWDKRCPAAFDFAITSPHRLDVIHNAAREGGFAAADYEGFKRTFKDTAQQCEREGITFVPMVFEPSGACGPTARAVFRKLVRSGWNPDRESRSQLAQRVRQKWCVLVRRQAARTVLRRMAGGDRGLCEDEPPSVGLAASAAATLESSRLASQLARRAARLRSTCRQPPPSAAAPGPPRSQHNRSQNSAVPVASYLSQMHTSSSAASGIVSSASSAAGPQMASFVPVAQRSASAPPSIVLPACVVANTGGHGPAQTRCPQPCVSSNAGIHGQVQSPPQLGATGPRPLYSHHHHNFHHHHHVLPTVEQMCVPISDVCVPPSPPASPPPPLQDPAAIPCKGAALDPVGAAWSQ